MKIKRHLVLALLSLVVFLCEQVQAEITPRNRFELFNECAPIDLIVEALSEEAVNMGLTEDRIQRVVEGRLKARRLFDKQAPSYLYVRIGIGATAFNIGVFFNKKLSDSITNLSGTAITWDTGRYGTHGKDSAFVIRELSVNLDEFIREYLRVNGATCGNRKVVRKEESPPSSTGTPSGKVGATSKRGSAGRGFTYSNVTFTDTKSLLTQETGKGYMGEMTNSSGKNYDLVNFKITVYGRGGTILSVVPVSIADFAHGETKSFVTIPFANSKHEVRSYKIAYDSGIEE